LREVGKLLAKGDHVQASEKGWSTAAQAVKALATKKGGAKGLPQSVGVRG